MYVINQKIFHNDAPLNAGFFILYRDVEKSGYSHCVWGADSTGSNPVIPTKCESGYGSQVVSKTIGKGSIPLIRA